MNCRKPLLIACGLCVLSIPACFSPEQFDAAIKQMDNGIRAIDNATEKITKESASWQKTLLHLETELRDDAQVVLANEV